MSVFTKQKLSGSTNGRGVKVAATSSAGTTIHTAVAGASAWDEVWIYAMNTGTSDVVLTLEWGGTSDPDDKIIFTITAKDGLKCVIPGLVLQNGLVLKAYAGTANVVIIHGFVNNIA